MASLVTEALATAGSLVKDDWAAKIHKLSGRAFDIKRELDDFILQCYSDFSPLVLSSDQINSRLSRVKTDVENLQTSFEMMVKNQIQDSTKEFEHLSQEHSKTSRLVDVLEKLYLVHSFFEGYNKNLKGKNFLQATSSIAEVAKVLDSLEGSVLIETNIYKSLRMELIVSQENIQYTLDEVWRDSVTWVLPDDGEDSQTQLSISFLTKDNDISAQDVMYSLSVCGSLKFKMQKLAKNFMERFIKPMVTKSLLYPCVKLSPAKCVITLEYQVDDPESTKQLLAPDIVFGKVQDSLEFLYNHLLMLKIHPNKDDDLMRLFSSLVCEETIKLLIDQCLTKSVPNSKEELKNYEKVAETVKKFEGSLKSINFLSPASEHRGGLMDFVSDIHVHFANQRCTAILAKARELMKMDIHETVEVQGEKCENVAGNILEKLNTNKEKERNELTMEAMSRILKPSKPLHENTMCLPRFRVSRAAKDIVDLAYKTLAEASTSSPECAMRLMVTTEHIFELYAAIVPMYHRESLTMLPQVAALHHNDCWYIAHHLLTMGHQFSKNLPIKGGGVELTFVQQVPMIRQLGSECFLAQMRMQRDQLFECLSPLKTFSTNPTSDKYTIAERPIKQVMHQLYHLRKIWLHVLPSNVLQTTLSTLVDSVLSEVINSICTMEDISSDDSVQLKTVCCLLKDQLPLLFEPEVEDIDRDITKADLLWRREVRKWQRLSELVLVLEASLRDIVDRWADGKGPLSSTFTVVEVKGLIRALFQNTERRAAAISKIRY